MRDHRLDKGRVALLATGGYGRGELAPFSDLDLLLVHDLKAKEVRSKIEPIATALWYPLWDAGVKLGHAVRTLKEQVDLARDRSRFGHGAAHRAAARRRRRTRPRGGGDRSRGCGGRSGDRTSDGAPRRVRRPAGRRRPRSRTASIPT